MNSTQQPQRQNVRRLVVCGLGCLFGLSLNAQNLIEYFWNTDPGVGRATMVRGQGGGLVSCQISTDKLPNGAHLLGIRALNGKYASPTVLKMVCKSPEFSDGGIVEYFWDNDPGIGHATPYPVTAAADGTTVSFTLPTDGLDGGVHFLGLRLKGGTGWSSTYSHIIAVAPQGGSVDCVEYFWDEDPGPGLATQLPFTGTDVAVVNTDIPSPSDYGSHTLAIRARAGKMWGSPILKTFCINAEPDFSLAADTVCRGEKFIVTNMTKGATDQTTYSWDMNGDGKADATGGDDFVYAYDKAGEYMVSLAVKTVGDCETTCTKAIVVLDTSNPSVALNASTRTGCSGDTLRFVAKPSNAGFSPEYEWTVNGEVVQGATGDTLLLSTLSDRDKVQVTVVSSNPCSQVTTATSPAITVTINALPEVALEPTFPVYTSEERFILSGGTPDGGTYLINGREAALFNPQANAPGIYTMTYRYADARGCLNEAVQTFELREPGESSLLLGDVNKDERVDIMDILCTVDHIYGRVFPTWNKQTADINSDGRINVTDIVGIAGIILGDSGTERMAVRSAANGSDDLTLTAADADAGNATEVFLDFRLRGTERPYGVQFDVTMPEGVSLESATDGLVVGRKAGSRNNTYTLLAYSTDMQPIGGTLSVKAVLPVNMDEGTYPIVPEDVVMAGGDMRSIAHTVAPGRLTVGSPTGIRGITDGRPGIVVERDGLRVMNAGGGSLTVYDGGGRFVIGSTIGSDNELVTVQALAQGSYIAEITKDGRTVRTKFIWKN